MQRLQVRPADGGLSLTNGLLWTSIGRGFSPLIFSEILDCALAPHMLANLASSSTLLFGGGAGGVGLDVLALGVGLVIGFDLVIGLELLTGLNLVSGVETLGSKEFRCFLGFFAFGFGGQTSSVSM